MSHFERFAPYASVKLALIACLAAIAACAARPAAPPVAGEPAAATPAQAGITDQQPPPNDDFVFVEKDSKKEAPAKDDTAPATSLRADQSARKQRVAK